jgi:hypothetical protein
LLQRVRDEAHRFAIAYHKKLRGKQGLQTILVRTGKFRPEDLGGALQPDAIIDSIADLKREASHGKATH